MYLPIMLDLKEKDILVVGGGKIGFRRAKKMMEYGGLVTVISLAFISEFKTLEGIICITKGFGVEDLYNRDLVIVATNDTGLNQLIAIECEKLKILCNRADDKAKSAVLIPACVTKGDLTIAVSSNGQSPSYSKQLLSLFESIIDEDIEQKLLTLGRIREIYLDNNAPDIDDLGTGSLKERLRNLIELPLEELKELERLEIVKRTVKRL
jgi:precorrin-2 dehydrogenase / sirohydrochlorin ferrochelatase